MDQTSGILDAAKCFRLSDAHMSTLRNEARAKGTSVQELLELKVFGTVAPRKRNRREVHSPGRRPGTPRPAFHFRMSQAQLDALHDEARSLGISVQALLELKVFGEIAPRRRNRRDARLVDQEPLDLELTDAAQEATHAA